MLQIRCRRGENTERKDGVLYGDGSVRLDSATHQSVAAGTLREVECVYAAPRNEINLGILYFYSHDLGNLGHVLVSTS